MDNKGWADQETRFQISIGEKDMKMVSPTVWVQECWVCGRKGWRKGQSPWMWGAARTKRWSVWHYWFKNLSRRGDLPMYLPFRFSPGPPHWQTSISLTLGGRRPWLYVNIFASSGLRSYLTQSSKPPSKTEKLSCLFYFLNFFIETSWFTKLRIIVISDI